MRVKSDIQPSSPLHFHGMKRSSLEISSTPFLRGYNSLKHNKTLEIRGGGTKKIMIIAKYVQSVKARLENKVK